MRTIKPVRKLPVTMAIRPVMAQMKIEHQQHIFAVILIFSPIFVNISVPPVFSGFFVCFEIRIPGAFCPGRGAIAFGAWFIGVQEETTAHQSKPQSFTERPQVNSREAVRKQRIEIP